MAAIRAAEETRVITRGPARFSVALPEKMDRDYWAKVADARWEPETFRLFDTALGTDAKLVDIGAWIGPTVLYAAALGATVTAFEPDPAALVKLRRNLALNPALGARITLCAAALVGEAQAAEGPAHLATEEPGNSMSGAFREAAHRLEVPAIGPSQAGLPALFADADLVKIDIEGGEFALIPALAPLLAAHRPPLHLSFHAQFLAAEAVGGAARRQEMMVETLGALTGYDIVYWARKGVWHRLADPASDLRAIMAGEDRGERGLSGAAVFTQEPMAIT